MRLTDNTILVTGALAASAARLQRLFTRAALTHHFNLNRAVANRIR